MRSRFSIVAMPIAAPAWMDAPRGPDVSPELRWYPVVTMLQLAVDMAVATGTPMILRQELLYMSLVTLSTVGYGDIVPAVPPARMLAVLEAVTGQIYLAVLIGGLVGMHMQRPRDA